ncbi:hypothetical protein HOP52_17885 [Halomonas campisalis]|uniref:Predicted pPIWI-associating nuclease domain-containing protein n=1 Tax=Billgrantia campisalis TaxID=74661 RepID=A0ABS9PDV2_9GAMM|nr:hypothetical protein [Halomonas campisalis]MCG6659624.1 hypothetical protein [Halomonas campisalis]MDR5865103.1 hypothetical protein [Halomonas campisalis]
MPRRISPSQMRSKLRQAQNKQKQAVAKYNREVRQHNQKVNQAVNKYNNEVRKHNARVRVNRQKIDSELRKMKSSGSSNYQIVRSSAITLNTYYEQLDAKESDFEKSSFGCDFLDRSEKENANSLALSNILESESQDSELDQSDLLRTEIDEMLQELSPELSNRWKGALFSLNPENPDAARHFCTSAREVFVQILDINAPDDKVIEKLPGCDRTPQGQPTRKEKIKYLLGRSGILTEEAINFVDEDVKNVLSLFRVFNDGTHGSSGKFGITKLLSIKNRVEDGIIYLFSICRHA